MKAPTQYYVEAEGVKSPVYTLRVADVPYVQKMQLEYVFPSYTGLEKETIDDGGDIAVWSVQGQGSTFTLTLPQHAHHEADGPYLRLAPLASTPDSPGGRTNDQEDA